MGENGAKPDAKVVDLGCRLNQADGAALEEGLRAAGFAVKAAAAKTSCGLIVVNSCGVTAQASAKSFASLRKLRRENPKAFIILSGCAASIDALPPPEGLPFDLLVPNARKSSIAALAAERFGLKAKTEGGKEVERFSQGVAKTRAYLKIEDGCDNFCAYCVVPFARGRERSLPPDEILGRFDSLLDAGRKEIVLTGVNLCAYSAKGLDLAGLLELLLKREGQFRLRLGSTEPNEVLKRVLGLMASEPRLCRFLHIPLQHGSEAMLKAMGRKYPRQRFAELLAEAAGRVPGIHLGTDLIAGLPGETEALFEESTAFLRSLPLAHLHAFSYSPREGTRAASMPDRPSEADAKRRHAALEALSEEKARSFSASQLGKTFEILTERSTRPGFACGLSDNYLKIFIPLARPSRNEFLRVEATALEPGALNMAGRLAN